MGIQTGIIKQGTEEPVKENDEKIEYNNIGDFQTAVK